MFRTTFIALALCLPLASLAWDAQASDALDLAAAPFPEQRERIDAELRDGKTYVEIRREEQARVEQALDRIDQSIGSAGGLGDLDIQARARVEEDQALVNGVLAQARADSRVVCRRETTIGSNRKTNVCLTVAQRRATRESSQQSLGDGHRSPQQ